MSLIDILDQLDLRDIAAVREDVKGQLLIRGFELFREQLAERSPQFEQGLSYSGDVVPASLEDPVSVRNDGRKLYFLPFPHLSKYD